MSRVRIADSAFAFLSLAGVAELADAPDLGSGGYTVWVQVPSPAPILQLYMRKWLSGRASPCQGEGREFESRLPLHIFLLNDDICNDAGVIVFCYCQYDEKPSQHALLHHDNFSFRQKCAEK